MNPNPTTTQRRYDLDWLRVLAILAVFIFHSGRFFDTYGWHVKNPTTYEFMDTWTTFLSNWMMPLIFVISGAGLYFALGKGGAGRFVKDKVLRLLVPLAVGIFTHVMLQVYLERVTHGQFRGTFFDFVPHYFDGLYGYGGNFAWMGLHLWYLLILFVFSVALYPLFRWLKDGSGARALAGLNRFLAVPGAIYLLAVPVMLLLVAIDPRSPLGDRSWGGWSLPPYILFFVYGFIVIAGDGVQKTIQRLRWLSLAAGAALVGVLAVLMSAYDDPAFGTPARGVIWALFGLCSWCWVVAILGFGMRHLNFNTRFLQYANEAVLPFYVLHQTVLLAVGYFVVRWQIPDVLKFVIIAAGSFAIILALYEFLIRRFNLLRFLFGMKPLRHADQPVQDAVPGVGEPRHAS